MRCIITLQKGNKIVGASRTFMPDMEEIIEMKENFDDGIITYVGDDGQSAEFDLLDLGEI